MSSLNSDGSRIEQNRQTVRNVGGAQVVSADGVSISITRDGALDAGTEPDIVTTQTAIRSLSEAVRISNPLSSGLWETIPDDNTSASPVDGLNNPNPFAGGGAADGSGVQTPWASNINAAGYHLSGLGSIALSGLITLNSDNGSSGHVLTSRGAAPPVWSAPASSYTAPQIFTHATGPVSLAATGTSNIYTNGSAAAVEVTFNLPTASGGLVFDFVNQSASGIRIVAGASNTIRMSSAVTATAGNVVCSGIGGWNSLVAMNSTTWISKSIVGPWAVN